VGTQKNNVQNQPQFASLLNEQTPKAQIQMAPQTNKTVEKPAPQNSVNPQVKTFVQKTQVINNKPAEKLPNAVPTAGVNKNVNNVISLTPAQTAVKAVDIPKADAVTMKPVVETPKTVPSTANAYIQVGSYRSEQEAQKAWQKISLAHASSLGGAGHNIAKADIAGRGTFYRLRVGPYNTRSDASSVCGNLSAKGQGCLVTGS
jgi:cell division protein FtsN